MKVEINAENRTISIHKPSDRFVLDTLGFPVYVHEENVVYRIDDMLYFMKQNKFVKIEQENGILYGYDKCTCNKKVFYSLPKLTKKRILEIFGRELHHVEKAQNKQYVINRIYDFLEVRPKFVDYDFTIIKEKGTYTIKIGFKKEFDFSMLVYDILSEIDRIYLKYGIYAVNPIYNTIEILDKKIIEDFESIKLIHSDFLTSFRNANYIFVHVTDKTCEIQADDEIIKLDNIESINLLSLAKIASIIPNEKKKEMLTHLVKNSSNKSEIIFSYIQDKLREVQNHELKYNHSNTSCHQHS